jgi:hypothetical protein
VTSQRYGSQRYGSQRYGSQRYGSVFKDDAVLAINDGIAVYNLVSKGRCSNTNSYLSAIE